MAPTDDPVPATLIQRARYDTGVDAEITLTNLFEEYGLGDFELAASTFIPEVNGLFVEGTATKDGHPIKIGAMAEKDLRLLYMFFAEPETFDALGGTALLGPVYLGTRPDAMAEIADPIERVETIAGAYGPALAERRKEEFELKVWEMKTQTETMIHGMRAFMYSSACGGWC